ncbi:MAG: 5'/3'-nucleotidase SurE [FCB group bacterium]|nr:5'/3'-nucleotidase SurE [FCB group bacterium]
MRPLILLTNDDGIQAQGLQALFRNLQQLGEICVVAPDTERSAVGHAITLTAPIRVDPYQFPGSGATRAFACTGTPADCVKLAVKTLLPRKPDLVVSGINPGANTGLYVLYSGTVSAATEGMILGIPSIAVSLDTWENPDFDTAGNFAQRIAAQVLKSGLPRGTLLNVNVPAIPPSKICGTRLTRHGRAVYDEEFHKRSDPRGRVYYWMSGRKADISENPDTDTEALKAGFISVTPIHFDLTDEKHLHEFRSWEVFAEQNIHS